uniref:Uncharacterized protein n=1 Tax=viral metagenome TaxID=1070528 RepID=A0A6C0LSJ8_9ZZZZ
MFFIKQKYTVVFGELLKVTAFVKSGMWYPSHVLYLKNGNEDSCILVQFEQKELRYMNKNHSFRFKRYNFFIMKDSKW